PLPPAREVPDGEPAHSLACGVDLAGIVSALGEHPLSGDDEGLVPAFNVYLASMPAVFYTELSTRYARALETVGLGEVARLQLYEVAETCAMRLLGGVLDSPEWEALAAPSVKGAGDRLRALVAFSNGMGWGRWAVTEHTPGERLVLEAADGYEAHEQLARRGRAPEPRCFMLCGVAAGLCELVYGEGDVCERMGQFEAVEEECRAQGAPRCRFVVEAA
ncbi:MAG: hypothetical protein D6731_01910, partial [Planctomycetota bacterium]